MRRPHHLPQLAPLGAAPLPATDAPPGALGSAGPGRRRWFPRRGVPLARVALASATLTSLGAMTAANLAEADAFELALRPAITKLLAVPTPAAALDRGPGGAKGPAGAARVPAAPADLAAGETPPGMRLHRVSPPPSPPAPPPAPPAVAVPGLARVSGPTRLSRLTAEQVRNAVPPAIPVPASPAAAPAEPRVPGEAGALPLGRGMWLYVPEEIESGNVDALVARARQVGLTHVYVRTGSSRSGFHGQAYMDELLPKAHAAGIRVYGWDFPYLDDVDADVARSLAAITHTTPSGHRIDGFAADIETASEGTNLTAEGAAAYGQRLRSAVGPAYPLVAVVPRPSPQMQRRYPYEAVIPPFDAVAPMTYWLNRQPDSDVVNDVSFLAAFGKPVIPVGQAYDGAPEGGRPGPPPPDEIRRFLGGAQQVGAAGVSFWSWQHASQAIWDTIQAAPDFKWEAKPPAELRGEQIRALQAQLTKLGHPVPASGTWDDLTTAALQAYQERAGLERSGVLDSATLAVIMTPFNPPVSGPPPA